MSTAVGDYVGRAAGPDLGHSRTTANINWGSRVLTWGDLPADVQGANAGGDVIGEGVLGVDGARKFGGVAHQVRLAWRAWNDLIVVVTVTRPLRRRPDGKLEAAGSWATRASDEYAATAPARHTRSTISPGPATIVSAGSVRSGEAIPREQTDAAEVFSYLPSPVRGALVKAVPEPLVWLGDLCQITNEGRREAEEVLVMCRIGSTSAVVLAASRVGLPALLAGTDWTINRHTFDLVPARPALGGRARTSEIGR